VHTDARGRYQLTYPRAWQVRRDAGGAEVAFYAPATGQPVPAAVVVTTRQLPDAERDRKLTAPAGQDTIWRRIQRLPRSQVLLIEQRDLGRYEEIRYDYTYAPTVAQAAQTHVVGRQVWRGGYEFRIEYRADATQNSRFLTEGQELVNSFSFTEKAMPSRRYADQVCDNRMYAIAATRYYNGQWEDDCQTIHEFSTSDITAAPRVHRRVLPFQSYALAKGFDNCLYSVTKAPTDQPELVYRYDPATRKGAYTTWKLPAQGPNNTWISAATDDQGSLYFLTSDANQLVKVSPRDGGTVTVLWSTDPTRLASYYPTISFDGAGTHGNFCLDDANTMYLVYSTDGSLVKVDLKKQTPNPELMALAGLPERGGYSDLLMQNDEAGRRRMYLAGPKALYKVDLARRKATRVRKGTYTDLAGCNLFQVVPRPAAAPLPPATAVWRGRVLNAATYQPLPQAQLRLGPTGAEKAVRLSAQGTFASSNAPGPTYHYRAQLPGYIATDSTWAAGPGPIVRDILLRPLVLGATLQLDNVQFEQGQAVLLPTSFPALDKLAKLMGDNPRIVIELRGHTDNVGEAEKNLVLSQERVAAVKAYLASRGVAETRISGIGLGGAEPIASNAQEVTRKLNRRVEFRVTGL
jgi:outer membrane protein OmpA-like peptidoglycan-associated protein